MSTETTRTSFASIHRIDAAATDTSEASHRSRLHLCSAFAPPFSTKLRDSLFFNLFSTLLAIALSMIELVLRERCVWNSELRESPARVVCGISVKIVSPVFRACMGHVQHVHERQEARG